MASWVFTFADTKVSVEDLPIVEFEEIGRRHDVSWFQLLASPGAHPSALYDVVCLAAKFAGVEPPPKPERMGDVVKLIDMMELVEAETLPTMWEDGSPLAEDQATT